MLLVGASGHANHGVGTAESYRFGQAGQWITASCSAQFTPIDNLRMGRRGQMGNLGHNAATL
jgi:hypothetical protein